MMHSKNFIAVPPGATIKEQLLDRGLTQKEFARRMDMSEKHISHLINGDVELTPQVALRLEFVLGLPASFWNNLEAKYQEQKVRVKEELEIEQDAEMCKKFPYAKMSNLGWVPKTRIENERIYALRTFFEVANLGVLKELQIPGIAYRVIADKENNDYALAAWAQKAKLEARKISTSPINIEKLKKSIEPIRKMTLDPPNEFCEKLQKILSQCGVAIVFLPHIGGSFLHGTSFLDGKHIVVGLTVRGKDADRFWFSLFHELFHIIDGHINSNQTTDEQERQADAFAQDTLISPADFLSFVDKHNFSKKSIISFANSINIDPGIVVGRLQKEHYIPYSNLNQLKSKYGIS